MGTTTIIDIIGAMIIGGILILTLLRVTLTASGSMYYYDADQILQQSFVTTDSALESDIRKIGYCSIPDSFPCSFRVDSISCQFRFSICFRKSIFISF